MNLSRPRIDGVIVWHGVRNLESEPAIAVDEACAHEPPDHWWLPASNPHIPFDFGKA